MIVMCGIVGTVFLFRGGWVLAQAVAGFGFYNWLVSYRRRGFVFGGFSLKLCDCFVMRYREVDSSCGNLYVGKC